MADKITENKILAVRYAKAFFGAISSDTDEKVFVSQLEDFISLYNETPDLQITLNSPNIEKNQVKNVISEISKKYNYSYIVKDFISIVSFARRASLFKEILKELKVLLKDKSNIITAQIYSARKLDNKILSDISGKVAGKISSKFECENIIDPELIGGLKFQIGSNVIDDTIAGKLERLARVMGA